MALGLGDFTELTDVHDDHIMHVQEEQGIDVKTKISTLRTAIQPKTHVIDADGELKIGKNIISKNATLTLGDDYNIGDEIDILAAASTKVKVSSADQSILYMDKYHTEGKDGYVQLKAGDHLHLIYKGKGYVDLSTWTAIPNPTDKPSPRYFRNCAFSHDDRYFAIASATAPYLYIYKVSDDGTAFKRIDATTTFGNRPANAVAFSPDNRYMAIANGSNTTGEISGGVTVYSMDEKTDKFTYHHRYTGEGSGATAVTFSTDSKLVFFGNLEQIVCGSLEQKSVIKRVSLTANTQVTSIAVSPDGLFVVAGLGAAPYMTVKRITKANPLVSVSNIVSSQNKAKVVDVSFSADGKYIAYSNVDESGATAKSETIVGSYNPSQNEILQSPYHTYKASKIQQHAFSSNCKYFSCLTSEVEVYKIDKKTFNETITLVGNLRIQRILYSLTFSHNNRYFVALSDSDLRIYNMRTSNAKQFIVTDFKTADGTVHIGDRFH